MSPAYYSSSSGPVYGTSGNTSGQHQASGSYSPTTIGKLLPLLTSLVNPGSPRYSPTTPNYGLQPSSGQQQYSPQYSPTTPGQSGASPRYGSVPQTQRYNMGSSHSPGQAGGNSSMYIPNSPRYNPIANSALPPGAAARPNPAYTGGVSPMEDSDSDIGTPQ